MYVCMHVCMHVGMYACMYVYAHTNVYIYICIYIRISIYHTYMCTRMRILLMYTLTDRVVAFSRQNLLNHPSLGPSALHFSLSSAHRWLARLGASLRRAASVQRCQEEEPPSLTELAQRRVIFVGAPGVEDLWKHGPMNRSRLRGPLAAEAGTAEDLSELFEHLERGGARGRGD